MACKHLSVKTLQCFIPGFNRVIGRGPQSTLARLQAKAEGAAASSLCELCSLFGRFIPEALLEPAESRDHSRRRVYSMRSTFWAFLSQVLTPQTPCREVVRRVQSYCSQHKLPLPDDSDSAYCQARSKLCGKRLNGIHKRVSEQLLNRTHSGWLWHGRRVRVVDGTGIRLPDTAANQKAFPQPSEQRPGCGFPVMQVVACFCLHTGALLHWVSSRLHEHESPLLRRLLPLLEADEVLLTDRGFASYSNLALCQQHGIDAVMRLHQARKVDLRKGKRLGRNDRLVAWKCPKRTPHWSAEEWDALPEMLTVRIVRVQINVPGFRVQSLWLVTTLLDPVRYDQAALAELYLRRWHAELFLRDIKTSMGMEELRCKSPAMVEKELLLFIIAYNLIRLLIAEAGILYHRLPHQISFKAAADSLRQYRHALSACSRQPRRLQQIIADLLAIIASAPVADRPGRVEPRAVKRRPKPYQRLTRPRHEMQVAKSRRNKGRKRQEPTLT